MSQEEVQMVGKPGTGAGRRKGTDMYAKVREAAARGEFSLWPMDYKILAHLNDEGAMFGGAYPLGHTNKQLRKEVFNNQLTNGVVFPRMNSMEAQGLVIQIRNVPGTGGSSIWQRTALGKQKAEEYGLSTNTDGHDV